MFENIKRTDAYLAQTCGFHINYSQIERDSFIKFAVLIIGEYLASAMFIGSFSTGDLREIVYSWNISILSHINRIKLFQIFVFTQAVQHRLELVKRNVRFQTKQKQNRPRYKSLQIIFIKLYVINRDMSRLFQIPLIFNLLQTYASLMIDSYWMAQVVVKGRYKDTDGEI